MVKFYSGSVHPLHPGNWRVIRTVLAEFVATAIFLFCGLASCIKWSKEQEDHDALLRIGFSFGLTLAGIIYSFGPVSGAHLNPAVTVACLITGKIRVVQGILYMLAQCAGAIVGSGALYLLQAQKFSGPQSKFFGLTQVNEVLGVHQGLFAELMGTMILVLAVLLLTHLCWEEYKAAVAIGIGFILAVLEFGFVGATGGSFNPARSLGPAVIVWNFDQLWVYWVGPMLGALVGVVFYNLVTYDPPERKSSTNTSIATSGQPSCNPLEDPHCPLDIDGGRVQGIEAILVNEPDFNKVGMKKNP